MLNELNSSLSLVQSYLKWFLTLPSGGLATFILTLFFVLLIIFEICSPREMLPAKQLRQSYRVNLELFAFNSVAMSLLAVPSLLIWAEQFADKGVLSYISNPVWQAVFSFAALDLLLYFLHKASHGFDFLWMFHKVHHNDPYLNVSTAFRIHLVEVMIITVMKAMLIAVLGMPGSLLLANETIIVFFTMLHHSNISFRGEGLLGRVIITPYLHRVHHSTRRNEHDRNYGTVLSIWDRLFGTLAELKPEAIGLNADLPQSLISLVMYGFARTDRPVNLDRMIAEAAYFKAEKRGFRPGHELRDWLEAKNEIIRLVYGGEQVRNMLIKKWRDLLGFFGNASNGRGWKYPLFR